MVSCSRVEHSVDFTTAGKKVLNIRVARYRCMLCICCAALWLLSRRDSFRWSHRFVLEVAVQPRGCFGFLQFPVTPPFLRISRAESARRAAIFTVMDRKGVPVGLESSGFVYIRLFICKGAKDSFVTKFMKKQYIIILVE